MSQKSRVYGNSLNNTIGDLTNVGENLLLYSFLEDSQEKFNNFNNFQGKLQKKLKKTLSHDLKGFNSQKILKNENYEKDVMIKLKNVNCPLAICEESKISEKTHKKSNLFERKLFRENENVKVDFFVKNLKIILNF